MNKMNRFLVGLTIASLSLPIMGVAPTKEQINQKWLYDVLLDVQVKHKLPAMGVAFVSTEDIHAFATCGFRAANSDQGVELHDQWHLGSCTKAMTATLAAKLVAQGVLDWDLTLAKVYGADAVHPDLREVTFRQLLGHRSGLGEPFGGYPRVPINENPRARNEVTRTNVARKPEFPVGSYHYSNLGYIIAGSIMELATSTTWENLMSDLVFQPMGMRSAGFGSPGTTLSNPPRFIYGHVAGQPTANDNPSTLGPAGTVHASIADWGKFVQHHLQGAAGKTRYLDQEHFQKLHTPLPGPGNSYALGWGITQSGGVPSLQHAGSNTYWYCEAHLYPSEGYAILVTTNAGIPESTPAVQELVQRVKAEKDRWIAPAKNPVDTGK
jgi:D-alanyl-D-alanine carboxypeptidase